MAHQKRKRPSKPAVGQSSVNAELYGRANYNPKKPESEDDESTKRHLEWLKKSCTSGKQEDIVKRDRLMDLTFYHRRQDAHEWR